MSRKVRGVIGSNWVRKHLSSFDHSFYSIVPEKFLMDTQIVSLLHHHFKEKELWDFKTCFRILSGNSNKIPKESYVEIQRSLIMMHDIAHGRFVVSEAGLETVREKHLHGVYGKCPRVHCEEYSLLPVGLDNTSSNSTVACFCAKCRDVYRSPSHVNIDPIAFGSSLPHLFLLQYPDLCPSKSTDVYVPKIYGFKIHSSSPVISTYENREQHHNDKIEY